MCSKMLTMKDLYNSMRIKLKETHNTIFVAIFWAGLPMLLL